MQSQIRCGIYGATGYSGQELVRLLLQHPMTELAMVGSRSEAGKSLRQVLPGIDSDLVFSPADSADVNGCDVVFFATPNGTAMRAAKEVLNQGIKLIDLSADFRFRDVDQWQHWYGMSHACPELLGEAAYGLPEFNRDAIRSAALVANPGCYVTATTLALVPLFRAGIASSKNIIADVKSGVSGAGRGAQVANLHAEVSDNFRAYAVAAHRHLPEIENNLREFADTRIELTFVPHLLPIVRGIHATMYVSTNASAEQARACLSSAYKSEAFVRVLAAGEFPQTRNVRASNYCQIAVERPMQRETLVVMSVIDNLVKGAAGQAVQNMNLMFGLPEPAGLTHLPMVP